MLPEADLRDLLPKPKYDVSTMTDKELQDAMFVLSGSDSQSDQDECDRLELVFRQRKKVKILNVQKTGSFCA